MLTKRLVKVRLLTSRAGRDPKTHAYWSQKFGEVIEVTKAEAKCMVEAGQAEDPNKATV